jgi:hypothetical protein
MSEPVRASGMTESVLAGESFGGFVSTATIRAQRGHDMIAQYLAIDPSGRFAVRSFARAIKFASRSPHHGQSRNRRSRENTAPTLARGLALVRDGCRRPTGEAWQPRVIPRPRLLDRASIARPPPFSVVPVGRDSWAHLLVPFVLVRLPVARPCSGRRRHGPFGPRCTPDTRRPSNSAQRDDQPTMADTSFSPDSTGRWRLPFDGRRVDQLGVDYGLSLVFDNGSVLRIESDALLVENSTLTELHPSSQDVAGALTLFAATVAGATVAASGQLEVRFEKGAVLTVEPDPHYEAWVATDQHGTLLVCLPGGTFDIWRPSP